MPKKTIKRKRLISKYPCFLGNLKPKKNNIKKKLFPSIPTPPLRHTLQRRLSRSAPAEPGGAAWRAFLTVGDYKGLGFWDEVPYIIPWRVYMGGILYNPLNGM